MVRSSSSDLSSTGFIPLYCSIVRLRIEHALDADSPNLIAEGTHMERVRPYEETLRQLNLFSLEHRRLRVDLILAFKIFKGNLPKPIRFIPPSTPTRVERKLSYRIRQGPNRLRRRSGVLSVHVENYRFPAPEFSILLPSPLNGSYY